MKHRSSQSGIFLATICTLIAPTLPHSAGAQNPTPPPPTDIRPSRLGLGTNSLAVYIIRGPDTTRTGIIRDELARVDTSGRTLLRRVYQTDDRVLGVGLDTIVDTFDSLSPVSVRSRSADDTEFLDFSRGAVRGWIRLANGDSVTVQATLPAPTWYNGTFDLVLRSAPLHTGWTATVPAFSSSTHGITPLTARVTGTDVIRGNVCWRVEAHFGSLPVTFWIDTTTRALRRQVMQPRVDFQILFEDAQPASVQGSQS